jgi:hypothetical protein
MDNIKINNSAIFCFQPSLIGADFKLRALKESDYAGIYECASDKRIWAGHPASDRHESEIFKPLFADSLASKACVIFIHKDIIKSPDGQDFRLPMMDLRIYP